jgi:hypothetical protein
MGLTFVYNAKSDKLNAIIDYAHKVIKPSTYNCNLCVLTHSNFGERKEWSNFKENLNLDIEFYHIDEFEKKFNQSFKYPVILNDELKILLDSKAINTLKDVTELIQEIKELIG